VTQLEELSRLLASDEELTQQKLADDTGVILDVDSLRVLSLNETGMFLVECLQQGVVTEEALVERLVDEFEVDSETAAADVRAFVAELGRYLIERRKRPERL
jgi:hypothetical protein